MLDIVKIIEICSASSPEEELPRGLRTAAPAGDLTRRVTSNPIPYALLLSIRRGGTFKDAAWTSINMRRQGRWR